MTYYIRAFADLLPEHFQEPRRPETVRRTLDGVLCVVAFDEGTEPDGWVDGYDEQHIMDLLNGQESEVVWYSAMP